MLSYAEENYLKAIYHLSRGGQQDVSTNAIAEQLSTKPASVSDMIRKLSKKEVVRYQKYQGVNISPLGGELALQVIRKHRLWEVFLVEHLKFHWDQVHEVAEQLEHIKSPLLIKRLDEFLGFPKYDPHGDPIPDEHGNFTQKPLVKLSELAVGSQVLISAEEDTSSLFLQYLDKLGMRIGTRIKVTDRIEFDGSTEIQIEQDKTLFISKEAAQNILTTE